MKSKIIIQRIPEHYVRDDYFQIILGYQRSMALRDNVTFKYMDWPNEERINSYIDDERKDKFPYSNIPTHKKRILFKKYNMVNQILSFEIPYLNFFDGKITYNFALKDGKKALLITDIPKINPNKHKEISMTRDKLIKLLAPKENLSILNGNNWCSGMKLGEQSKLLENYKADILDRIKELNDCDILIDAIDLNNINKIPTSYITSYEPFLLLNGDKNGGLSFLKISFETVDGNLYTVFIDEIELPKYSLSQTKSMSNAIYFNSKEPKISKKLNHNITFSEIKEAKSLVLTKNN